MVQVAGLRSRAEQACWIRKCYPSLRAPWGFSVWCWPWGAPVLSVETRGSTLWHCIVEICDEVRDSEESLDFSAVLKLLIPWAALKLKLMYFAL